MQQIAQPEAQHAAAKAARSEDRRMARTRRSLLDALHALMQERRYDSISIQDIIDRADVGRSTFYAHFRDKDDLAIKCLEQMFDILSLLIEPDAGGQRLMPVKEWLQHVKEESRLFRNLIRGEALELFFDRGQAYWSRKLEARLQLLLPDGAAPAVPLALVAKYMAGTLVSLLQWWLDNGMPCSPEQMDEYFHRLVWPSVRAAVGEEGSEQRPRPSRLTM